MTNLSDATHEQLTCQAVRPSRFASTKGAFTGAAAPRQGMLKKADNGVLFLDEIGELGGDEQAMLLRALEEKSFYPVGSDREVHSDFQLIAGTNRDLGADVGSGAFREDLLARLNLWTFRLPKLRDRPEDIECNLEYELEQIGRAMNLRLTFSREARERFLRFDRGDRAVTRGGDEAHRAQLKAKIRPAQPRWRPRFSG